MAAEDPKVLAVLADLEDRLSALERVHEEQARLGRHLDPFERGQLVERHRKARTEAKGAV